MLFMSLRIKVNEIAISESKAPSRSKVPTNNKSVILHTVKSCKIAFVYTSAFGFMKIKLFACLQFYLNFYNNC